MLRNTSRTLFFAVTLIALAVPSSRAFAQDPSTPITPSSVTGTNPEPESNGPTVLQTLLTFLLLA
jgi:hypothetical protein